MRLLVALKRVIDYNARCDGSHADHPALCPIGIVADKPLICGLVELLCPIPGFREFE